MPGLFRRAVGMVRRARVRRSWALEALELSGFGVVSAAGFEVSTALGLLTAGAAMVYLANVLPGGDDADAP